MKTPKLNCIVVDDDPLFLRKMETFVTDIDWLTFKGTFREPSKAISNILDHSPDLVFLDIEMPEMDGYRVLDQILREHTSQENFPKIVIVTANYDRIRFKHKAVALTCYKPDLRTSGDLEATIMKIIK